MKQVMVLMLSAVCLVGCQGCKTDAPAGGGTVHVSVLEEGKLSVNGHVISGSALAKKVNATGARPTTAIEVSIPSDAPQTVMVDITRQLRKAGYTKILFVRPRQVLTSN